ncbi:PIG-P-domain-containing protein [Kockiozyma suomiensis]|uniref:PIG-P-domain-containing protein n=1 Tax=Kockiozyma suomiensis TaxID=1337062 RepID=UPI003342F8E1
MMKRSKSSASIRRRRPRQSASSSNLEALEDNSWQFQPPFYNHPPTPLKKPTNAPFSLFTSGRSSPRVPALRTASVASDSDADIPDGDKLAKESDVTVGGDAVPPEREYFGFALYVSSTFAFIIYILWTFLPQVVLHSLKIYYYPSRWWALAFPSFMVMFIVYIYVALISYNVEVLTPKLDNLSTITDDFAVISQDDKYLWKGSDGVWDLPLESVNYVLYADRHHEESNGS